MEKIKKSNKIKYIPLRFSSSSPISYNILKEAFEYEPTCFSNKENVFYIDVSYNKIIPIIEDILNNSKFELNSVSEDERSVTYHFIKY